VADNQFVTRNSPSSPAAANILAWLPAPHAGALTLTTAAGAQRLLGQLAASGPLSRSSPSPRAPGPRGHRPARADRARKLLVAEAGPAGLLTVCRHGSCLFLRYAAAVTHAGKTGG